MYNRGGGCTWGIKGESEKKEKMRRWLFTVVRGGIGGIGGTLKRVKESYIGRVLSDVDEGITPRGFMEFKRRYIWGLGKAIFIAGFARGLLCRYIGDVKINGSKTIGGEVRGDKRKIING